MKRLIALFGLPFVLAGCFLVQGPGSLRVERTAVDTYLVTATVGTRLSIGSNKPINEPLPAKCKYGSSPAGPRHAINCPSPGEYTVTTAGVPVAFAYDGVKPVAGPASAGR